MLLDDFPRGVTSRKLSEHRTPLAAWADTNAVAASPALSYGPSKILLGRIGASPVGVGDDRHIVTVAGSRAGKGVSAIVPNLILYEGSVLAIDPKAELASITARHRAEGLGQKVYVLDPFDRAAPWVAPYRASFNPLSILTPDSPTLVEDAGLIADALVVAAGNDPHWDDSARNIIEGIVLHVATYPGHEGQRNLVTVRQLLMNGASATLGEQQAHGMDGLEIEMLHNVELMSEDRTDGSSSYRNCEALAAALDAATADFFEKPENERGSVLSTARRHTKFLDFASLRSVLAGHDFDLTTLKTAPEGMTVYLCLPVARLATCSRWFRLFVNLALEALEREQRKPQIPVLLCLDEFARLGHMRQVEAAAGQIAGFGVKLCPILQDLTQLKRDYKEGWETFLGNAGILQFFGNNDMTTLEYISRRLGKTSMIVKSVSSPTPEERKRGATGENMKTEIADLLTGEEAARFFGRDEKLKRQLVIRAGRDPLVLERTVYHDSNDPVTALFADKFDDPEL